MRPLHALTRLPRTVFWFGEAFRCDNDYHTGYNHEREDTSSHGSCAATLSGHQNGVGERCGCDCADNSIRNVHYMTAGSWEELQAQTWQEADGRYICVPCQLNMHPRPPIGEPH